MTSSTRCAKDRQEGGSHYRDCAIQPIDYILGNGLGFAEGNVVKYVTRWKTKGGVEDLRKARHYLDLLIEHVAPSACTASGSLPREGPGSAGDVDGAPV